MKRLAARLPLLVLLAACAAPVKDAPPGSAPRLGGTCGATRHADLVGQRATALERVLLLGEVRVIRPGDMVTQDFRPQRINFEVGDTGRIGRIYCG